MGRSPGWSAAHVRLCVPLLPSGSDGVGRFTLHRARAPDVVIGRPNPDSRAPREGIQPCYSGLQVEGTANSPPSTAKIISNVNRSRVGGEGGIRTHGAVTHTHAFQACSFGLSDTSPYRSLSDRTVTALHRHEPGGTRTRYAYSSIVKTGGEGGIRTHVPGYSPDKTISSRPRYDHFGTSPRGLFLSRSRGRHFPAAGGKNPEASPGSHPPATRGEPGTGG